MDGVPCMLLVLSVSEIQLSNVLQLAAVQTEHESSGDSHPAVTPERQALVEEVLAS